VKVSGTYMNTTNLVADDLVEENGGVKLVQEGQKHRAPGYDLPLGKPLPVGTVHAARGSRERWVLPAIDLGLCITETSDGFNLGFSTEGGLDRVPMEIELAFEGPGEWETENQVIQVADGQTAILKSGYGTFRRGAEAIRIGPGCGVHRTWQMRASDPDPGSFRVLLTLQTPVDHVVEIRCGTWSPAVNGIL